MTIETQQRTAATILAHKGRADGTGLTGASSFHKSRICTVHHSLNPLVAAASPIFTVISQIQYLPPDTDLNLLQQNLHHELCAFENAATQQKYRPKIITAAKYGLCCFIDECIEKCQQFDNQKWSSILTMFHDENEDRWQFYVILEHTSSDPNTYLDVLELLYLCLSFGYEGQYKNNEHGFIIRENIINNLYKTIRAHRKEGSDSILLNTGASKVEKKNFFMRQFATTAVMTLSLLGIFLGGGYILLQRSSHNLEAALTKMIQTASTNNNITLPKPTFSTANKSCCTMNTKEST